MCRQLSEGIGFRCHYIDKASKAAKFGPKSKKNFGEFLMDVEIFFFLLEICSPALSDIYYHHHHHLHYCSYHFHQHHPHYCWYYLSELLHMYTPSRDLRSSADTRILKIPCSNSKAFGQRSFSLVCPSTWNGLPYSFHHSDSQTLFRHASKTHLFQQFLSYSCFSDIFSSVQISYYVRACVSVHTSMCTHACVVWCVCTCVC